MVIGRMRYSLSATTSVTEAAIAMSASKGWTMSRPDLPVYFISGADDPCMRSEAAFHASAQHLADMGYHNVTSALYTGMRHEVLNEVGKEMVWDDVLSHINFISLSDNNR